MSQILPEVPAQAAPPVPWLDPGSATNGGQPHGGQPHGHQGNGHQLNRSSTRTVEVSTEVTAEVPAEISVEVPVQDPVTKIRMAVSLPLRFGDGYATPARVFTFDGLADGGEHIALGLGDWQAALERAAAGGPAPLVRPHSECLTGDVFGSQRCDCGAQLREAVEQIAQAGGFLLYLRQEGRGIGLYAKLDAYALQDAGLDTYEANVALGHGEDERDYTVAAEMLRVLGVDRVALLSNNPDKADQLERLGVRVTERVPTGVHLSDANLRYLMTKVSRAAHTLDLPPVG